MTKTTSAKLKKGDRFLATVRTSESGEIYIDSAVVQKKSVEVVVLTDAKVKNLYLQGRGVNGRRSSTNYGSAEVETSVGFLQLSLKLRFELL